MTQNYALIECGRFSHTQPNYIEMNNSCVNVQLWRFEHCSEFDMSYFFQMAVKMKWIHILLMFFGWLNVAAGL